MSHNKHHHKHNHTSSSDSSSSHDELHNDSPKKNHNSNQNSHGLLLGKELVASLFFILCLTALIIFGTDHAVFEWTRIILGSIVLLRLPGRRICSVAFSKKEIDLIERIALSFALSISVVPLLVFYLNLAGLSINEYLVIGVVVSIVIISFMIGNYRRSILT